LRMAPVRQGAPDLICAHERPTARSAIKVSATPPRACHTSEGRTFQRRLLRLAGSLGLAGMQDRIGGACAEKDLRFRQSGETP
jgi:hypothetical protein